MRAGRAAAAGAAVAALALLAGCSSDPPLTKAVLTGHAGVITVVLTDTASPGALQPGVQKYAGAVRRVQVSSGSPAAVATGIKHGQGVDVAVLPAGPDLQRVRDELVAAPAAIGTLHGVRYFAAAVTGRGLGFVAYLRTKAGAAALRAGGFGT